MTNWSQLYNEPTVSVKYKDSNSVIVQSSIELQQCVDRQVKLLYERAMALSACAQFQTALRDATAIQELAPLSSLGYYAAGYNYMQYGKQKEAIDVLDQGLTVVSDPIQQQRLQSLGQDATARLSLTIDFISKLPLDIVSSFIIPSTMTIPSKDAFSYLHVCKTWRERALQSTILHFLTIGLSSRSLDMITPYSTHIRHLILFQFQGFPFGFLNTTKFDRLQSLHVSLPSPKDIPALSDLFQSVGGTLEEVSLSINHIKRNEFIPLSALLGYCPNLLTLESNCLAIGKSTLPNRRYPSVKKLMIYGTAQPLGYEDTKALLSCFPSLEYLTLAHCENSRALELIQEYCPLLHTLTYSNRFYIFKHLRRDDFQAKQQGLQALTIVNGNSSSFQMEHIISFISTHRHTLGYIRITAPLVESTSIMPQDIQLNHLTALNFNDQDQHGEMQIFAWIIRNAPNVQKLTFARAAQDDVDICRAMKNLRHLKELSYNSCSPAFIDFMNYQASLGEQSLLAMLSVVFEGDPGTDLFPIIYRLSRLQSLSLRFFDTRMNHVSIEALAQGCPGLTDLALYCDHDDGIPSPLIYQIRLFPKLTSLSISNYASNPKQESLLSLLRCKRLQNLKIEGIHLTSDVKEWLSGLLIDE